MSRWAEFLGENYMTTHGRFVPYEAWHEALYLAMIERGIVPDDGWERNRNFISLICSDWTFQDKFEYSVVGGIENTTSVGHVNLHDVLLQRIGIEEWIQHPQRFAPYTTEYLWMFKRVLDCFVQMKGSSTPIELTYEYGEGESLTDCKTNASRTKRAWEGWRDEIKGYLMYNDWGWAAKWWSFYSVGDVLVRVNKPEEYHSSYFGATITTPSHLADSKVSIWGWVESSDTYWNPKYPEKTWVEMVTMDWQEGQQVVLNFEPSPNFPPNDTCSWKAHYTTVFDLRPGLEFYDPL